MELIKKSLQDIIGIKADIIEDKEKQKQVLFCSILEVWRQSYMRDLEIMEYNLNLIDYNSTFYILLEQLIFMLYGSEKAKIINWWVYNEDYIFEGKKLIAVDVKGKEYKVGTPKQLYNFLKKI